MRISKFVFIVCGYTLSIVVCLNPFEGSCDWGRPVFPRPRHISFVHPRPTKFVNQRGLAVLESSLSKSSVQSLSGSYFVGSSGVSEGHVSSLKSGPAAFFLLLSSHPPRPSPPRAPLPPPQRPHQVPPELSTVFNMSGCHLSFGAPLRSACNVNICDFL